MSTFTLTLGEALEYQGCAYPVVDGRTIITNPENIGLGHYPIFDEAYRPTLNGLIVDRYLNREIGLETISLFTLALRRRMNEVMPMFNDMYKSTLLNIDPLATVDLKSVSESSQESSSASNANSASEANATSGTRAINSEFPQTMLSGDSDYASSGADTNAFTENIGSGSSTDSAESQASQRSESTQTGSSGHQAALLQAYRESLVNVDMMVLDSLSDLFMLVWDVPNVYTNRYTIHNYLGEL